MERRNFVGRSAGNAKQKDASVLHSVHVPGAKHYRIKRNGQVYIFSGISPKQFKELPNAKVVGRFSAKKNQAPMIGGRRFEIVKQMGGQSSVSSFEVTNSSRKFYRPKCYVPVGNDEYLVYEKFFPAYVAVPGAVAAAAIAVALLAQANDFPINPLGIAPTVNIGGDGGPTAEMETIDFAGYDSLNVSDSNPYVLLQNPETNDVYFSYVLSDDAGNEIKTTDLIPPGKAMQWDAKSDLGSGEHVINMSINTYDMENTAIPYNGMSYDDVKVVVQ